MRKIGIISIVVAAALATVFLWPRLDKAQGEASASLVPLLSEENDEGFAIASESDAISFPEDLGSHEAYQTEWWYYTGNLETEAGRQFGFQLTFFRRSLTPPNLGQVGEVQAENQDAVSLPGPPAISSVQSRPSHWRTDQIYMGHFTISDIEGNDFFVNERFSRGSSRLAGAQSAPYFVWLEDWRAEQIAPGMVRLYAQGDLSELDLTLTETLDPILHGEGGLSVKGDELRNASYYYSIVQQKANGTITVEGERFEVKGLVWKDHEYGTSALSEDAVGWDWFSLQLDDGSALMLFQIRRSDGTLEPASSGTFIFPDGTTESLELDDWRLNVLETWKSPQSGTEYPSAWEISIPALRLDLVGRPLMANQELIVSTVYWEGVVSFKGKRNEQPVTSDGYVEMTGYLEALGWRS